MRNRIELARDNIGGRAAALVAVLLTAALSTLAACGSGGGGGATSEGAMGADTRLEETTASPSGEERMLEVRRIGSGSLGQGAAEPRAVVATSSETLAAAANLPIRGAESTAAAYIGGEEAYVAVLWGEKNTGGYTIEIEDARLEGDRVSITIALQSPPEGAIVSQALTYPYAVAALGDLDPSNKDFILTDETGRELEWPVETV